MTVTRAFPTIAGDLVSPPNAASRDDDGLSQKNLEPPALSVITKCSDHTVAFLQQRQDRVLHVNINALVNSVVLERANHLQPSAITHMRQAGILVPAEIALQNAPVRCPVKERSPGFE